MLCKQLHSFTLFRSKRYLTEQYGRAFFHEFKRQSTQLLHDILPEVPDIGKSVFSSNYEFGPPYIAWLKTLENLGMPDPEIEKIIWKMNELNITAIPQFLRKLCGKLYFSAFRKKVRAHVRRQGQGKLHDYDWTIEYRELNKTTLEFDIYTCGLQKLAHKFGADKLLPTICRMDYLLAKLLYHGFERTKTLGDGDDCCNCRYVIGGQCEWAPEKGFAERK